MEDILEQARKYKKTSAVISRAHYIAWERANKLQNRLGVPVVISTAIVGTTIFATINENPSIGWKITAGLISLIAAVLSALQSSFKFSETADNHKSAGASYAAMRRDLDLYILRHSKSDDRHVAIEELKKLNNNFNELAKKTPSIPDKLYYSAVKEINTEERKLAQSSKR